MLFKRLTILAVLAASLCVANADDIMFSGNDEGRWIGRSYRLENADMFDVYHTAEGRPFEPILQQVRGKLTAIQAVGKTLRVAYGQRACAVIDETGTLSTTGNMPGKLLSMCESPAEPGGQNELMMLVLRSSCPKEFAAENAQVKSDEWLCLYKSYGWEFKAVAARPMPQEKIGKVYKSVLSQSGGRAFILLLGQKGAGFITWSASEAWKKPISLKDKPLDMLNIDGTIFLVYTQKVENGSDVELRMAKFSADGKVASLAPVKDPQSGEVLTWKPNAKMTISSLGKEAGICWRGRITWEFLTVDDKAQASKALTVDDLLRASSRMQRVEEVMQYFLVAIISAGFAVMFLLKPYITTPRILMLPPTLKPANLIKRVVALIADLLIVQIPIGIVANYFLVSVRGVPRSEIIDMMKEEPQRLIETCPELMYFGMAFVIIFAVYGTAMEMMCGWTIGKKIMGLRVVTDDAVKPPLREAALRNIFKIVALVSISPASAMPWYFLFLVIVMFVTRYRQRIGDLIARTVVVEAALPSEQQQIPQPPDNSDLHQ